MSTVEQLSFRLDGHRPAGHFDPVLVGVVGSGNLEVLIEPAASSQCMVEIQTSVRGYGAVWRAVIDDFHGRHGLAGLRISINDMGATPAVVSLRLDQAVATLKGPAP